MSTQPATIKDERLAPDATLEGVRELLFGRQVRLLEQQLTQQTSAASQRLEAAQSALQQRIDAMEARSSQQFANLNKRITQLAQQLATQHQAMQETQADRTDLAEVFSDLAGRLDAPSATSDSVALN